jgi:hypothetical protein
MAKSMTIGPEAPLEYSMDGHTPLRRSYFFDHLGTAISLLGSGADTNGEHDNGSRYTTAL